MKKVMVGAAVALALVTSNAAADGIDRRPPPSIAAPAQYAPPLTWTGFYIGAGIGGAAIVHDHRLRDDELGGDSRFNGIGDVSAFGTAIVGWDWQVSPNAVLGIFGDFDFGHNNNADFSLFDGMVRTSIEHDHTWSVGARLGVLTSPSTLWYASTGFTQARFETHTDLFDGELSFDHDHTFNGWFVGGGVDTRLAASNWFLRLEYRFSQFQNERFISDDEATRIDFEPTVHTVRAALTYKFSGYGWGANGWGWGR